MQEITVGIAGAAGDGLDKSGDTLARSSGRMGLHVYAYNSYQSIIRGGHIWLKVRIGNEKVYNHGDNLNVLIALNQDSLERHSLEVNDGGVVIFNSDKFKHDSALQKKSVFSLGLPIAQITKETVAKYGPLQPIMQNTIALGAVMYLCSLGVEEAKAVLMDTFAHKDQKIVDLNISLLNDGYTYAKSQTKPIMSQWNISAELKKSMLPFITGNEAIALGAVASGCKFYSAYPMTPASTILHWMASHAKQVGVAVKQCEDELSVINMAIGAGIGGVRSMCATAGGGFALMTEAIGMAGIMEVPVVCVEVQRGGPSTGLPTKTEQADLFQVYGASQGEFPRLIVAPTTISDAYDSTVEAFHMADKYQLPALIISDLLLSEHPETVEANKFNMDVKIDRGELVTSWNESMGKYKRYKFTDSGVSPRALPGTANTLYVSPSDDHDEESILISDMYTTPATRKKIMEKRMRKMDNLLNDLTPPKLEGPNDADVTLLCWGSTYGVVKESLELLNKVGIKANLLCIKYIVPFHVKEVMEILNKAKKKYSVEVNFTSQMARFVRSETGIAMDGHINRYDGEPIEPAFIVTKVKELLTNKPSNTHLTEAEAMDMAYHYLRTHGLESMRPVKFSHESTNGHNEPTWLVEFADKKTGDATAKLKLGAFTGSNHEFVKL